MKDIYLQSKTKESLMSDLSDISSRFVYIDDDGTMQLSQTGDGFALDYIGVMEKPGTGQLDEEGNVISPIEYYDGVHCNVRVFGDMVSIFDEFSATSTQQIYPATPVRRFGAASTCKIDYTRILAPLGLPIAWDAEGVIYGRENLTPEQNALVDAALAAYDPLPGVKDARIIEATAACEAVLEPLGREYGRWETATWDQQYAEAVALMADPDASVPLLAAMCVARGVSIATLAARVIANRDAWVALTGNVIGQRQRITDQISAATTVEEVEAIPISITLPTGG